MADQVSSLHLQVETHQASSSQDAGSHRHIWVFRGLGLGGLALLGVSSFLLSSTLPSPTRVSPSDHEPAFAFNPPTRGIRGPGLDSHSRSAGAQMQYTSHDELTASKFEASTVLKNKLESDASEDEENDEKLKQQLESSVSTVRPFLPGYLPGFGGFPPALKYSIDLRQLLKSWEGSWAELIQAYRRDHLAASLAQARAEQKRDALHGYWQDSNATALMHRSDMVQDFRQMIKDMPGNGLEAVGLVTPPVAPNQEPTVTELISFGSRGFGVNYRAAANDANVLAVTLFSRGELALKDDSKGTLLKIIEAQFAGEVTVKQGWFRRRQKHVAVFAIEGVALAPDTKGTAKGLLDQISNWARSEERLVVLTKRALYASGVPGLTGVAQEKSALQDCSIEYYEQMGFTKLEMSDGSYELVYLGFGPDGKKLALGRKRPPSTVLGKLALSVGSEQMFENARKKAKAEKMKKRMEEAKKRREDGSDALDAIDSGIF